MYTHAFNREFSTYVGTRKHQKYAGLSGLLSDAHLKL